jgi:hypothetical protein
LEEGHEVHLIYQDQATPQFGDAQFPVTRHNQMIRDS